MRANKGVVDLHFPDGSVSVLYVDVHNEEEFDAKEELRKLVEWAKAKKEEGNETPLVEALNQYGMNTHIFLADTGFDHRSAVAYKKQRIAIWKALGRRIRTR